MYRLLTLFLLSVLSHITLAAENLAAFSDSQGNINLNVVTPDIYQFDTINISSPNITLDSATRILVNRTGFYQVTYSVNWRTSNNSRRQIRTELRKNGIDSLPTTTAYGYARRQDQAGSATNSSTSYIELNANDYIELVYQRDSTISGNANSIAGEVSIQIEYVSPLVGSLYRPYAPDTYIQVDEDLRSRSPRGLVSDGQFFYILADGQSRPLLYRSENLSYWEPISGDLGPVFDQNSSAGIRDMVFTEQGILAFSVIGQIMYTIDPVNGIATAKLDFENTPIDGAFGSTVGYDGQNLIGLNRRTLTIVDGISTNISQIIDLNDNSTLSAGQLYNNFKDMVIANGNAVFLHIPNPGNGATEYFVMTGISTTIEQRFDAPSNCAEGFVDFEGQNLVSLENGAPDNKAFFHDGLSEYTGRKTIIDPIN